MNLKNSLVKTTPSVFKMIALTLHQAMEVFLD